jgi:hypothetical protein
MASSAHQSYGQFLGTGASINVTKVGFKPNTVKLSNANGIMLEWDPSLPDGYAYKTLANGTRSVISSNGITPISQGFTLGTDSINGNGEVIRFSCFGG